MVMRIATVALALAWLVLAFSVTAHAELLRVTVQDGLGDYPDAVCLYLDGEHRLTEQQVNLDDLKRTALASPSSTQLSCKCNSSSERCKRNSDKLDGASDILFVQVFPT